ncbi:hypothetical protein TNCV_487751 [Trichonephila clavipes]|nr:hypothetical protein TNCV_487751 [Trichonephila clavipes]
MFAENETALRFVSDNQNSRSGFDIRVRQITTCNPDAPEPQLLDIMIVQFRNEKVSNHGSIPIPIDCNVVAFIVFEEGFHQPIKRTKQSVFLDVTVFRHTLVDWLHSKCGSFVC